MKTIEIDTNTPCCHFGDKFSFEVVPLTGTWTNKMYKEMFEKCETIECLKGVLRGMSNEGGFAWHGDRASTELFRTNLKFENPAEFVQCMDKYIETKGCYSVMPEHNARFALIGGERPEIVRWDFMNLKCHGNVEFKRLVALLKLFYTAGHTIVSTHGFAIKLDGSITREKVKVYARYRKIKFDENTPRNESPCQHPNRIYNHAREYAEKSNMKLLKYITTPYSKNGKTALNALICLQSS